MKILIAGTGGVGGYFGGKLAKSGVDVSFLARGKNLTALKKNGLTVESLQETFQVRVKVGEKPPKHAVFDLILICVKAYETEKLLPLLAKSIGKDTLVISIQNGLERHRPLVKVFGAAHVAGGLCYLGAYLKEPGVVKHVASGKIVIGALKGGKDKRLDEVVRVFRQAKIDSEQSDEIVLRQWEKLIWNVGFNGPTAMVDLSVGEILKREEGRRLVSSLMHEAVQVGKASGMELAEDLPEKTIQYSEKEFPTVKTSMQWDRNAGKPLEWEIFYGFVSRQGKKLGVATPAHDFVSGLLEVLSPKA